MRGKKHGILGVMLAAAVGRVGSGCAAIEAGHEGCSSNNRSSSGMVV
jgi:hypothetical protein